MLLLAAATYWGLAGLFRSHLAEPTASRYIYLGAILIVLVGLELMRGAVTTRRTLVVLGLLAAFAAVANFNVLKSGSSGLQENSRYVSAELGALELARSKVDPDYRPDLTRAPQVYAGEYLEAVDDLGSPADSPTGLDARPEPVRQAADLVLARALKVQATPAIGRLRAGPSPVVDQTVNGQVAPPRVAWRSGRPSTARQSISQSLPRECHCERPRHQC